MAADAPSNVPQWAVNWILSGVLVVVGACTTFIGWVMRRYVMKVDALMDKQSRFATTEQLEEVKFTLAPLITRQELAGYINQMREDNNAHYERMRQDRLQMHLDNQRAIEAVSAQIKESRDDIRAVHTRIDDILKDT